MDSGGHDRGGSGYQSPEGSAVRARAAAWPPGVPDSDAETTTPVRTSRRRPAASSPGVDQSARDQRPSPGGDVPGGDVPGGDVPGGGTRQRPSRGFGLVAWLRREVVFAVVLVGVAGGFGLVSQNRWRRGLLLIGVVLVVAGCARLALPARRVGLLAVRGRVFDTLLLLVLGGAVIGLTTAVPYLGP